MTDGCRGIGPILPSAINGSDLARLSLMPDTAYFTKSFGVPQLCRWKLK